MILTTKYTFNLNSIFIDPVDVEKLFTAVILHNKSSQVTLPINTDAFTSYDVKFIFCDPSYKFI